MKDPSSQTEFDDPSAASRELAEKSSREKLKKSIRMALEIEQEAVSTNTRSFNQNRYTATGQIDDYESLKDRTRELKEHAIERLPELVDELKEIINERGGNVYLAEDGADAREYITRVCEEYGVTRAVKSKSITNEEIDLNEALEYTGVEVVETDLAEFILQLADEPPSHIVAPAIHRTRERISELFKKHFDTDRPLDTGEDLTRFARDVLRKKFLSADAGITGANFISADTGSLAFVESEGNIRMTTHVPPIHVAVAGVEKILPRKEHLGPFLELLAPSATGQPLTSYTSVLQPPMDLPTYSFNGKNGPDERAFHLVLLDNGRFQMREDDQLREALYCIRCSACLNTCANFQVVGGHAFGGDTYAGGIGGSWEAGTNDLDSAHFNELCTGCSRCVPQCPVRIDIPWLNTVLRNRLNQKSDTDLFSGVYDGLMPEDQPDTKVPFEKQFFGRFSEFAKWGSKLAPFSNWLTKLAPVRYVLSSLFGVSSHRDLPSFCSRTLIDRCQIQPPDERRSEMLARGPARRIHPERPVLLVADPFTNYVNADWGKVVFDLYQDLGLSVQVSEPIVAGRSALSQGMIDTATKQARDASRFLDEKLSDGYDLVVIEPSELAMYRMDNRRLMRDEEQFERIQQNVYGSIEYLEQLLEKQNLSPEDVFDPSGDDTLNLFYHAHCQQRTLDLETPVRNLLEGAGYTVRTSTAECCGMAGSFGYKDGFYEVSQAAAEHLLDERLDAYPDSTSFRTVASGVSCREQIEQNTGTEVLHPAHLLKNHLRIADFEQGKER